jgi:hypothetical protein
MKCGIPRSGSSENDMGTMTRRDVLRLLPLAGLGLWAGGASRSSASPAYFLLTDDPDGDLWRLIRSDGRSAAPASVTRTPVGPSAQDLTLLVDGAAVDPIRQRVPPAVARLAHAMRGRQSPAHTLLAIEPHAADLGGDILFEVDGVAVERIPVDQKYSRIEIAGVQGRNVFRLEGGRLSVVDTSCRHELCRRMGAQSSGRIICAPNRLVATLPGRAPLIDAITG